MKLEDYGFILPKGDLAISAEEAAKLANQIGFPVVMKIQSQDIMHKTDIGGVALNLHTNHDVRAAFDRITKNVSMRAPQVRVDGIRVEEMCPDGIEVIIGLNRDPQFGSVIMFGLGGVFTKLLDDISFRVLPITPEDACDMIKEIKGYRILEGYRGQSPASLDLLISLLMQVNNLGLDLADQLVSVDFNLSGFGKIGIVCLIPNIY
jgi:acyl-CoA synthetase (NDP forming)